MPRIPQTISSVCASSPLCSRKLSWQARRRTIGCGRRASVPATRGIGGASSGESVVACHSQACSGSTSCNRKASSYRQSSRFYCFCALPRGCSCDGVLLYCCAAIENRLAALCVARSPRAARASRATNPRPSGLVALDFSRKLKLRLRRCTQPRAAKAIAGVAVVGKMTSIPRAAAVV